MVGRRARFAVECIRFFFHGTVTLILSVFFSTEEFVYSLFFDA